MRISGGKDKPPCGGRTLHISPLAHADHSLSTMLRESGQRDGDKFRVRKGFKTTMRDDSGRKFKFFEYGVQ